jgi:hypothetical protein
MSRAPGSVHRVLILAAALVLSMTGTTLADTPVGHSGTYGPHSLTDSGETAGARCVYDSDLFLYRIKVLPPTVFARNRTSSRDSQWVGWRIDLRYRDGEGGGWGTVKHTSFVKAKAYDDTPGVLSTRSIPIGDQVGGGEFQVIVRMQWYKPGHSDTWEGTARHQVDHYDSTEIFTEASCISAIY